MKRFAGGAELGDGQEKLDASSGLPTQSLPAQSRWNKPEMGSNKAANELLSSTDDVGLFGTPRTLLGTLPGADTKSAFDQASLPNPSLELSWQHSARGFGIEAERQLFVIPQIERDF